MTTFAELDDFYATTFTDSLGPVAHNAASFVERMRSAADNSGPMDNANRRLQRAARYLELARDTLADGHGSVREHVVFDGSRCYGPYTANQRDQAILRLTDLGRQPIAYLAHFPLPEADEGEPQDTPEETPVTFGLNLSERADDAADADPLRMRLAIADRLGWSRHLSSDMVMRSATARAIRRLWETTAHLPTVQQTPIVTPGQMLQVMEAERILRQCNANVDDVGLLYNDEAIHLTTSEGDTIFARQHVSPPTNLTPWLPRNNPCRVNGCERPAVVWNGSYRCAEHTGYTQGLGASLASLAVDLWGRNWDEDRPPF